MNIFGAGGHASVIIDILQRCHQAVAAVWDDHAVEVLSLKIAGKVADARVAEGQQSIIAIGNNATRKKLSEYINSSFGKAIHPSSNIAGTAVIGDGTVIMAGVAVNPNSVVGRHVILNTNCSVDHDCIIGDFVHISPNAALAGNVSVGEGTHIGIGACVIQNIKIGRWVTIGAGTVIIKDIPDYATVVGNPGKIIKIQKK